MHSDFQISSKLVVFHSKDGNLLSLHFNKHELYSYIGDHIVAIKDLGQPSHNICVTYYGPTHLQASHTHYFSWQDEIKSGNRLPPELRETCRQAFASQSYRSSRFQDDVLSELSLVCFPKKNSCGYRLDALVEVNGMKVGIEVDVPSTI